MSDDTAPSNDIHTSYAIASSLVHWIEVSAFAGVLLFAGARIDGARRLHSPAGMTKRRCPDCVEAQPSKSVSTYQSTSPPEMYVGSEAPCVSPGLAKGAKCS